MTTGHFSSPVVMLLMRIDTTSSNPWISMDEKWMTKGGVSQYIFIQFGLPLDLAEGWRTPVLLLELAMATVLPLPLLPVVSSILSASSSFRCPTSPCGFRIFRQPIWCTIASDRTPLSCGVVDGTLSSSWIGVERNVDLERSVRCCASEEKGACTTSGCGVACEEASSGRREILLGTALLSVFAGGGEALARDRRNRKEISPEEYLTSGTGLKYYDVEQGKGTVAERGETVMVHFDCVYRSITAVSSRESKILAGNRTIAEPYELTVGAEPGRERKRDFVENANGLFSAQAAPKPPPALYSITEGMRVGGRRTVIVPPDFGYGQRGLNEIPPGATFDLNIELLEVKKTPR